MDTSKVIKLREQLEVLWSHCHSQMDDAENLYDGNIEVEHETGQAKHIPPYAAYHVESAVGSIIVENPVITIPPIKETQDEKKRADRLEKGANAEIRLVDKQLALPLLHLLKHSAVLYGLGVAKGPYWNPLSPDKPEKEKEMDLVSVEEIVKEAEKVGVDEPTTRRIIEDLHKQTEIYRPKSGYVKSAKSRRT